jgi:Serine carboxypeptidase S28
VEDLSTDSLRWLTNAQSLEDSAYFMKNLNLSSVGIKDDVTAYSVPWVYYGGSYAGARAAHMRVLYPDITFGAIASSAVTHATIYNWEYMDIIRTAAPKECSDHLVSSIAHVDNLLARPWFRRPLRRLFGLGGLTHDDDFVSTISWPLGSFQEKNWDEEVGNTSFEVFCAALAGHHTRDRELMRWNTDEMLLHPDGADELGPNLGAAPLDFTLLNYAKYIREASVSPSIVTERLTRSNSMLLFTVRLLQTKTM